MSVLLESMYTGLWEFFAASHVFKCPVQSVFPALGWEIYREHCNCIIQAPGCLTEQKVFVMWSSSHTDAVAKHWVPNHFVPLMLREVPWRTKEGKFRLISWNGSDYVGQVQDISELPELACVSFLPRK